MGLLTISLCSLVVVTAVAGETIKADEPYLWVQHEQQAQLECCNTRAGAKFEVVTWVRRYHAENKIVHPFNVTLTERVTKGYRSSCGVLNIHTAHLNDSGLYQCWLHDSHIFTPGTYLHVYKPLEKTIDLSESTKNKILTAEGVLLLLCVILPSANLLFQSKRLSELEKKKMKKEEENIYQGLNLDDCCTTYDQIERSQAQGQYEDVCNGMESEDIQLEKP